MLHQVNGTRVSYAIRKVAYVLVSAKTPIRNDEIPQNFMQRFRVLASNLDTLNKGTIVLNAGVPQYSLATTKELLALSIWET